MGFRLSFSVSCFLPRCLVLRAAGACLRAGFPRCCVGVACFQLYGCGLPAGCAAGGHWVRCLGSGFGCCPASVGLSAGLRLLGSGLCFPAVVLLVCVPAVVGASVLAAAVPASCCAASSAARRAAVVLRCCCCRAGVFPLVSGFCCFQGSGFVCLLFVGGVISCGCRVCGCCGCAGCQCWRMLRRVLCFGWFCQGSGLWCWCFRVLVLWIVSAGGAGCAVLVVFGWLSVVLRCCRCWLAAAGCRFCFLFRKQKKGSKK